MCPAGSKSLETDNLYCPKRQGQVKLTGLGGAAFRRRKWGCGTETGLGGRAGVTTRGSAEGGKPTPKLCFLSSLTWWLFHGIHKIHLSRQARGGEEEDKGRKRESVKGTRVPKCNNIKINPNKKTGHSFCTQGSYHAVRGVAGAAPH